MDDKDLNSLKDIEIPEPSADAKARAFEAVHGGIRGCRQK